MQLHGCFGVPPKLSVPVVVSAAAGAFSILQRAGLWPNRASFAQYFLQSQLCAWRHGHSVPAMLAAEIFTKTLSDSDGLLAAA